MDNQELIKELLAFSDDQYEALLTKVFWLPAEELHMLYENDAVLAKVAKASVSHPEIKLKLQLEDEAMLAKKREEEALRNLGIQSNG